MLPNPNMLARPQVERDARPTRAVGSGRSYSDEEINPEKSLTVSSVLAAFTILSEDLSSLPLLLYSRKGRNKFRAYDSIYYRLMHDQPNPEMSSMVFRELMMGHLLAWGNSYSQIVFDKSGNVVELWPLRPDRMTVARKDGVRLYTYQSINGKPETFLSDEILHIPAFGFDGLIGYSRIALSRNSIGLAISAEKYGNKFFANDAKPGVVYQHPGKLSVEAYGRLKDSFDERKSIEKSHESLILEEGMSIDRIGIPPDDAQFLETRKFQVSEIARIFRVPPHMIGDVERSTSWGTGIDSQEQGYVNHTLRPWATRIEQSLNNQLLLPDDRSQFFYEHLMDGLLRGDIATRYEAYVKAITTGVMSPNEARAKENMNPYSGGDTYWRPLNMTSSKDTTAPGDLLPVDNAPTSALQPLWMSAVARVMKRESNDVSGAAKRLLAKGKSAEFRSWVEDFYKNDHTAFVRKQLQPILDAQARLFGINVSGLESALNDYTLHAIRVVSAYVDAEKLLGDIENIAERHSDALYAIFPIQFYEEGDDYE